jgi:RimJ/RimL family protein N-acetyltransferase
VRHRDTGAFVGSVGLIAPEGWPQTEATWTIAAGHQGRGYAQEAASAVLAHAFGARASPRGELRAAGQPDLAAGRRGHRRGALG